MTVPESTIQYGPKTGSVSILEIPGSAAGAARDNWVAPMPRVLDPFRFLLITVAGWMNQRQLPMIDYLREENRVLREQLALANLGTRWSGAI
jgi:hypothetical protein